MTFETVNQCTAHMNECYKDLEDIALYMDSQVSCGVCEHVFKALNECMNHMKLCHEYKCENCEYQTDDRTSLRNHIQQHHERSQLAQINEVVSIDESVSNVQCGIYGNGFEDISAYHIHRLTCLTYSCSDCEYKTDYEIHFKEHKETAHERKSALLNEELLKQFSLINVQLKVITQNLDQISDRLLRLERTVHSPSPLSPPSPVPLPPQEPGLSVVPDVTKPPQLHVSQPQPKPQTKVQFRQQPTEKRPELPHNLPITPHYDEMDRENFKFNCKTCGSRFRLKDNLIHHLKYVHGIHNFNCAVCPLTFANRSDLKWHLESAHYIRDNQWQTVDYHRRPQRYQAEPHQVQRQLQPLFSHEDNVTLSNRYAILGENQGNGLWE